MQENNAMPTIMNKVLEKLTDINNRKAHKTVIALNIKVKKATSFTGIAQEK
jgi:hypothetical protein